MIFAMQSISKADFYENFLAGLIVGLFACLYPTMIGLGIVVMAAIISTVVNDGANKEGALRLGLKTAGFGVGWALISWVWVF